MNFTRAPQVRKLAHFALDKYLRDTLAALELIAQGSTEKGREALLLVWKHKWKILKYGVNGIALIAAIIGVINNLANAPQAIEKVKDLLDG